MAGITNTHSEVIEWLEERQGRFIQIADTIWENPETALKEFKACKLHSDDLAADGFTITRNIGGLPTAFMAEYTNGEGGPIIGFLGEYDALPGLPRSAPTINRQSLRMVPVMGVDTTCWGPPHSHRPA